MKLIVELAIHLLAKGIYEVGTYAATEAATTARTEPLLALVVLLCLMALILLPAAAFLAGVLYTLSKVPGGWRRFIPLPRRGGRR